VRCYRPPNLQESPGTAKRTKRAKTRTRGSQIRCDLSEIIKGPGSISSRRRQLRQPPKRELIDCQIIAIRLSSPPLSPPPPLPPSLLFWLGVSSEGAHPPPSPLPSPSPPLPLSLSLSLSVSLSLSLSLSLARTYIKLIVMIARMNFVCMMQGILLIIRITLVSVCLVFPEGTGYNVITEGDYRM
jgi:hypothetical protein